jgi:hypothetical protein
MTPLQQAVTELIEKIDALGASPMDWPELFAVSKALEAEQAQAVEPIGYIRHADKTFWPHPECAVYASVSPSLAPVYAHPAPPAQQVAVPMTEAQIFACDPVPHVMFDQQRIDFARAIEAFHGITPQGAKLVTKPDSRPQNCGTGHCSCIECLYPKTDWSAA